MYWVIGGYTIFVVGLIWLNYEMWKQKCKYQANAKYWQTIAENYGAGESFYYTGLAAAVEESRKLTNFILSRYHGEKPSGQGRDNPRPS